jgi:hypothetical protein
VSSFDTQLMGLNLQSQQILHLITIAQGLK